MSRLPAYNNIEAFEPSASRAPMLLSAIAAVLFAMLLALIYMG